MRLPFWCLSPLGEIVDASIVPPGFQLRSGFASEARFLEFKMPPNQPNRYAGTWTVVIQHQGRVCFGTPQSKPHTDTSTKATHTATATASTHSVVTTKIPPGFLPRECKPTKDPVLYGIAIGVGSNFRMQPYVQPGAVYVGDPILLTAVITEAGLPVIGCKVTVTATSPTNDVWTMKLFDDGAHSDGGPSDGEYANNFTHAYEAGTYHFVFHATGYSRDGQPVVREVMRDKVVQEKPTTTGGGGQRWRRQGLLRQVVACDRPPDEASGAAAQETIRTSRCNCRSQGLPVWNSKSRGEAFLSRSI